MLKREELARLLYQLSVESDSFEIARAKCARIAELLIPDPTTEISGACDEMPEPEIRANYVSARERRYRKALEKIEKHSVFNCDALTMAREALKDPQ